MTRVDFYVLQDDAPTAREQFACRLVEKAFKRGHRIHLRTRDARHSQMLDDLLWSFRQGSFVPHVRLDDGPQQGGDETPVTLGAQAPPAHSDVLVNLTDQLPELSAGVQRIVEVLDASAHTRAQARQRYRHYREQGYRVDSHTL